MKRALLNNRNEINIVPKHFMYCPRKLNVILTQLLCSASFLNNDLFKSKIVSSPNCACGVPRGDAFHFFFECSKYTDIRKDLLICVNRFSNARFIIKGVSRLRTEFSSLFHSITEEEMNDEFVEESLQRGLLHRCHYVMDRLLYFE
jgi:hypothetical protein